MAPALLFIIIPLYHSIAYYQHAQRRTGMIFSQIKSFYKLKER
jgi:hypothetical protein